jgi:mycothiol synthase
MAHISSPSTYTLRAAARAEARAIAGVIIASDIAELGAAESSVEDVLDDWKRAGFALETDAQVAVTTEGRVVGYGYVWERDPGVQYQADGYTHPEYEGRGIGTQLVRWMVARARQMLAHRPHDQPAHLIHYVHHPNEAARALFEREGFRPARYAWRMLIEMDAPPPAPQWPAGIQVRTFLPGEERQVHAVVQEAFGDLEDFTPMPFETWAQLTFENHDFDPSLYFVAQAGEEIAGLTLGFKWPKMGWIRHLAVQRPWRRQGLGLALLQQAFGEFYRRGERKVGLGVDSENATGATRLYHRAGMSVARQFDQYRKELA